MTTTWIDVVTSYILSNLLCCSIHTLPSFILYSVSYREVVFSVM